MLSIRSEIALIFLSESLICTKGSPPDTLNLKKKKKKKKDSLQEKKKQYITSSFKMLLVTMLIYKYHITSQ